MAAAKKQPSNRKHIRFTPDPLDTAFIDISKDTNSFHPSINALIVDEAPMGGCGVILKTFPALKQGFCLKIKVGKMEPLNGVVRWIRPLDAEFSRVGIEFLE